MRRASRPSPAARSVSTACRNRESRDAGAGFTRCAQTSWAHAQLIGAPASSTDINVNIRWAGRLLVRISSMFVSADRRGRRPSGTVRIGLQRVMQFLKSVAPDSPRAKGSFHSARQLPRKQGSFPWRAGRHRASLPYSVQFIGGWRDRATLRGNGGFKSDARWKESKARSGFGSLEIKFLVVTQAVQYSGLCAAPDAAANSKSFAVVPFSSTRCNGHAKWQKKTQRWRPLGPQRALDPVRGNRRGEGSSEGNCA